MSNTPETVQVTKFFYRLLLCLRFNLEQTMQLPLPTQNKRWHHGMVQGGGIRGQQHSQRLDGTALMVVPGSPHAHAQPTSSTGLNNFCPCRCGRRVLVTSHAASSCGCLRYCTLRLLQPCMVQAGQQHHIQQLAKAILHM